jgi:hypothetical protein
MEVAGRYGIWKFENPNQPMVGWIKCLDPACAIVSYSSYGDGKQTNFFGIMATNKSCA